MFFHLNMPPLFKKLLKEALKAKIFFLAFNDVKNLMKLFIFTERLKRIFFDSKAILTNVLKNLFLVKLLTHFEEAVVCGYSTK